MTDAGDSNATNRRGRGPMSDERRQRVRMEISREAARLFWEQGVANTTGEQIAEAVGLSVSTIWRYFRNKESCAEPVLEQDVEEIVIVLRRWPREVSLEDRLLAWATERPRGPGQEADDLAAMRMISLSKTEPAIRTAWLMACDKLEHELVEIIADRLRCPTDDPEVRLHAATANSVVRIINEDASIALMAGVDPASLGNQLERMAHAMRVATGGVLGDPADPIDSSREDESGGNDGE